MPILDFIFGPRRATEDPAIRALMIRNFPATQRTTRDLFRRWADQMNAIEDTGKLTTGRAPTAADMRALGEAIGLIETSARNESVVVDWVYSTITNAERAGRVPRGTVREMNLARPGDGFGLVWTPLLIIVAIAVAILAATLPFAIAQLIADINRDNTNAAAVLRSVELTGQPIAPGTLPGTGGPSTTGPLQTAASMLPMLMLGGFALFAFSTFRGRR